MTEPHYIYHSLYPDRPIYCFDLTNPPKDHWVDFEVREITAWSIEGDRTPIYMDDEYNEKPRLEIPPILSGFVKSDGCSHLEFDFEHVCGLDNWRELALMLPQLYRWCMVDVMGRTDELGDPIGDFGSPSLARPPA